MIPSQQQSFPFENISSHHDEESCFRNYNNVRKFGNVFLIILFCYFSYRIIWIIMDGLMYFFLSFICICAFKWNNRWNWNQLQQYTYEAIFSCKNFVWKYFPKIGKKWHFRFGLSVACQHFLILVRAFVPIEIFLSSDTLKGVIRK